MGDYPLNILDQAIKDLKLSVEFKEMAMENGFNKLSDMVSIPTEVLEKRALQDKRLLLEYIDFIQEIGLGDLID